jgi:hypothetical protein
VEHISTGHVLDDAQRRRAKYLGHLPYGCVISFLECDWTDIVPAEILDRFADDIERRRKNRRDKAAQEERERLQAERLEAAALRGSTAAMRRQFDPVEEERVPAINASDFQPLSAYGGGASPPDPRPGFEELATISTSPSAPRTVWGTPAIPVSPDLAPVSTARADADDGWLKDDDFLGAAELAMQMEAIALDGGGGNSTPAAVMPSTGKGKKKKQKITLMSTGGRRGN